MISPSWTLPFEEGIKTEASHGERQKSIQFGVEAEPMTVWVTSTQGKDCFQCGAQNWTLKHILDCTISNKRCEKCPLLGHFAKLLWEHQDYPKEDGIFNGWFNVFCRVKKIDGAVKPDNSSFEDGTSKVFLMMEVIATLNSKWKGKFKNISCFGQKIFSALPLRAHNYFHIRWSGGISKSHRLTLLSSTFCFPHGIWGELSRKGRGFWWFLIIRDVMMVVKSCNLS